MRGVPWTRLSHRFIVYFPPSRLKYTTLKYSIMSKFCIFNFQQYVSCIQPLKHLTYSPTQYTINNVGYRCQEKTWHWQRWIDRVKIFVLKVILFIRKLYFSCVPQNDGMKLFNTGTSYNRIVTEMITSHLMTDTLMKVIITC